MGILYATSINVASPTFARLTKDQEILAQWVKLALKTPRGQYWSAPEYGCSLRAYVLQGLTDDQLAVIPAEVEAALEDERIARVEVTAARTYLPSGTVALKLDIVITPKTGGPFSLAIKASAEVVTITTQGL